jgi:hypothetical protein
MGASKKHHYLPQFYLKGFTNEEGNYYVFDKKTEEIRKTNPLNSFFVNNRNTSIMKDERFVLLEDIYAQFDSLTAPQLEIIRNSTIEDLDLGTEAFHRVKMFITQMYWRVPRSDEEFEKMIDKLTFADAGFDIKNKTTGKSVATEELQKQLKEADLFRKMYRIFLPLISYQEKYRMNDFENLRVYFRPNKFQLTSDNPLIIKEFKDFRSLNEEMFFPISCDKIFVHTKQPKPKNLPNMFLLDLDMMQIQQATRFVCCSNKEYLEYLINNLYSYSKNFNFEVQMKERLFSHFK